MKTAFLLLVLTAATLQGWAQNCLLYTSDAADD